jgi:hypothetical protein
MLMTLPIPVYVINLKERVERLNHIKSQFEGKDEFEVHIVEAIRHEHGAIGLWRTIQSIFELDVVQNQEYIVLCEDDHEFTGAYVKEDLIESIQACMRYNVDMLLGGPSWVLSIFPVERNMFWVDAFTGLQFTVIFKKFFSSITAQKPDESLNGADFKIGGLTNNKLFIYPFISVQKEFGYSDATPNNNEVGRVERLFVSTTERVRLNRHVLQYYAKLPSTGTVDASSLANITIPTYVINLPERIDRRLHIEKQFEGKPEFDVTIVEACKDEIGALGLWRSLRKIIQLAIDNDDDVIVISEDDHEFTENYSKEYLLTNIIEAGQQGVDYLSGGSGGFGAAFPISRNRYWASTLLSSQFIVVYRPFFEKILAEPYDNDVKADIKLSELTSNKMVIHPYISVQKDFGYSDVTPEHNIGKDMVDVMFKRSQRRLSNIQHAYFVVHENT